MSQAALPNYMQKHLAGQDIAPGHRFGLYFPVWQDDWSRAESAKKDALKTVAKPLPPNSIKLAENLQKRQQALALQNPQLAYFPAKSTSPFMTGIGNEHPLENGFAFLNPYGLPYLPGSSVKGVLRTTAEQLALGLYGETGGWDMLSVWWLFGFEAGGSMFQAKPYHIDVLDEEAQRRQQDYQAWLEQPKDFLLDLAGKKSLRESLSNQGALCFWDVYPQSKNLSMGILTPHHGGYFNGKNAPHDSEQPIPNVFLTIPPNSLFHFYCTCASARLPKTLQENWQAIIRTAFEYAFDWLGFGAKTAVGYGQMSKDTDAEQNWETHKKQALQKAENDRLQQELENKLAAFSPMAQDFIKKQEKGKWLEDKDAFVQNGDIENWLDQLAKLSDEVVINHLIELFDRHFPGLLSDPDKVQGKKQKPVFSDRQRKLAKALNSLKLSNT